MSHFGCPAGVSKKERMTPTKARMWGEPIASLIAVIVAVAGCTPPEQFRPNSKEERESTPRRSVSLDYCADQYVLKFMDPASIVALSPDATAQFSYMRRQAAGIRTVRAGAEEILLLKPDTAVRFFGGDARLSGFLNRVGTDVVQIGYATDLAGVKTIIRETAQQLGATAQGDAVIDEMNSRIAALPALSTSPTILYVTSKGAVAGRNTIIDDLITTAGLTNFQQTDGWGSIMPERLVNERPDIIATSYFDTPDLVSDNWTPARHPVVQKAIQDSHVVDLPGAWTACSGWFLVDAVEALSDAAVTVTEERNFNG